MNLSLAIINWDGKSAEDIAKIYHQFHNDSAFVDTLLELLAKIPYQVGSTWLLKHYFEEGYIFSDKQVSIYHKELFKLQTWEAKLHALQSFTYLPIAKASVKLVENFLRATITDNNKFVRAWSYNGFYVLAKQYPSYQKEVTQFLDLGLKDEAPSVKARIRNIIEVGFEQENM
jgi:hypothetical protein